MIKKTGILIAAALASMCLLLFFARTPPYAGNANATLARSTQILKVAQTEKFQSDLRFAESNVEAAQLVGGYVKLGRIDGAGPVVEMNVREGGVIELLLDEKDKQGRRLRAIILPMVTAPFGSHPLQWQCVSGNWENVTQAGIACRFDVAAWEMERQHITSLREAFAQLDQDAERARAKHESEQAGADFDRQRAQLARESERAREEEERQLGRIERATERSRLEYERQRR